MSSSSFACLYINVLLVSEWWDLACLQNHGVVQVLRSACSLCFLHVHNVCYSYISLFAFSRCIVPVTITFR